MRRRALLCIVGATALAGCRGRLGDESTSTDPTTATTDESLLELSSHDLVRSNEGAASELVAVTGEVHNPSTETVAEATVTAVFEDANGETLDRASASASDLSPAQSWTFELIYPATGDDARAVADYTLTVQANS